MSWSSDFVAALDAPSITPIYILEVLNVPLGVGDPVFIYSDRGALQIGQGGARIVGTSVIPHRWSVSFGGFELNLVGDIRPYRNSLIRGALCVLRVSLLGLADERIAIGQIDQISGLRGRYRVVFKDYLSASQSRFDTRYQTGRGFSRWFYDTVISTTVDSTWTVGDTSLVVRETDDFTKQTGVDGLLYCVPTTGDPFYMRWSAKNDTTDTFTVSGSANHPSTSSASNLAIGDVVYNAARILGAPHAIFAKLVTSTGNGTNGPDDNLPASYGNGAPLHYSFFDRADASATNQYIQPSSGTFYQLDMSFREPIEGGMRSIMDLFANVGQWPVMRQGSFSWRGCSDPTGNYGKKPPTSAYITDDDVISFVGVQFFDSTLNAVYFQSSLYNNAGNTTKSTVTNAFSDYLPVAVEVERSFGDYYDPSGSTSSMATGDIDRMKVWDFYHWTKITLEVRLRFAILCAGDVVQLTSAFIQDLSTQEGGTYNGRFGMVLEVGYNISERVCTLIIGFPPEV